MNKRTITIIFEDQALSDNLTTISIYIGELPDDFRPHGEHYRLSADTVELIEDLDRSVAAHLVTKLAVLFKQLGFSVNSVDTYD